MATNPSFLALPSEIRLKVYQYLLPTVTRESDYTGLRRTCRGFRREFDYEALKSVEQQYDDLRFTLAMEGVVVISSLRKMLATSTLKLELLEPHIFSNAALKAHIIPWDWHWLTDVVITMGSLHGTHRIIVDVQANMATNSGRCIDRYESATSRTTIHN
jgi:hypothetical protein